MILGNEHESRKKILDKFVKQNTIKKNISSATFGKINRDLLNSGESKSDNLRTPSKENQLKIVGVDEIVNNFQKKNEEKSENLSKNLKKVFEEKHKREDFYLC